jgi:dTDP-3-amino-3,4,6-trideoxy-alpha-D-glucose transaminase
VESLPETEQLARAPNAGIGVENTVPFVDLTYTTERVRDEVFAALETLLGANTFANGPHVAEFEREFAAWCGASYCVGVASGLDALRLGLLAAGIGPGDEIVVPALTFIATFEAVTQAGAKPVVADVQPSDYNLDPAAATDALTERTACVLPVHLYGQMADMRSIQKLAAVKGLLVLEDACQAHGAMRDGLRAGIAGDMAGFSFYPSKNLGAMGDAGALTTPDEERAMRVRALRQHGETSTYRSELRGYTARLDTIQALVLLCKLRYLTEWNAQRTRAAAFYSRELAGVGDLRLPPTPGGSSPVWHLYVVRTENPDEFAAFLRSRGITTARHYPQPPHLSRAYVDLGLAEGAFPVAEAIAREAVSLPLFPGISDTQLGRVCETTRAFFGDG